MDERPFQFTLRNLLIELTLIAVALGLIRAALVQYDDPDDPRFVFSFLAVASLPPLVGAIIGGLTGQYAKGAVWVTVIAAVLLLIALLFLPTVQG
jgi:hypothetical protein